MRKRNKKSNKDYPGVSFEVEHDSSENSNKNSDYIKKLELQVLVLNKILNNKAASKEENWNSRDNPDSIN